MKILFKKHKIIAKEAFQIMWYGGFNDKLTSVELYKINASIDKIKVSVHLSAQMIWSFIEGFLQ